jgi:hypothetical protein
LTSSLSSFGLGGFHFAYAGQVYLLAQMALNWGGMFHHEIDTSV